MCMETLSTPSKEQVQNSFLYNNWKKLLMAVLVLLMGGVGSFILIRYNKQPSSVLPPPQPFIFQSESITQAVPVNYQLINTNVPDVDIKNAYVNIPETSHPMYILPNNERNIHLENGVGTFLYCEGSESCNGAMVRNATITLSTITRLQDVDATSSTSLFGGFLHAFITHFIFDDSYGKRKESYLAPFNFFYATQSDQKNQISIPFVKDISSLRGVVTHIEVTPQEKLVLSIESKIGFSTKTFLFIPVMRYVSEFVELSPDATKKIFEDTKLGYRFSYPVEVWKYPAGILRALEVERVFKTTPVYFSDECGLRPTFADESSSFWIPNPSGAQLLNANLKVHTIGTTKTLYLTSTLYGYNPADWGNIIDAVSTSEYVNEVTSGKEISGREVVVETIHGYQVRHIKPFSVGRPCDTQTREQYQWVKKDLLFSLVFIDSKNEPSSLSQKEKFIESFFSTLEVE